MPDNHSPVRVAKDDFGSHIDEFVYEKQTTLKHFLMNQHTSSSLSGYDQDDTQQIGCKSRPRSVSNGQDRTIDVVLNFVSVGVLWDIDIITSFWSVIPSFLKVFGMIPRFSQLTFLIVISLLVIAAKPIHDPISIISGSMVCSVPFRFF